MPDDGSVSLSNGSSEDSFDRSFSVGDFFRCEYFEEGEYEGCEETFFRLQDGDDGKQLTCENLTLDANHSEESAVDIEVTQIDPGYLRNILDCVESYLQSGEEESTETGYIQGTHTDQEGPRDIIRLKVSVSKRGIDFSSIDKGGTDILDYVRIPTTPEYRRGESEISLHLERFCSVCRIFLSATENDGDIFEAADYYVDPNTHFHRNLKDRCLTVFPDGDLEQSIRTAGVLLEEEVSELLPNGSTKKSPVDLMNHAFRTTDPKFEWGYRDSEQEGIMFLYAGAILALRNPMSHRHPNPDENRYLDDLDRDTAVDILCFFNFLLSRLDRYGAGPLDKEE